MVKRKSNKKAAKKTSTKRATKRTATAKKTMKVEKKFAKQEDTESVEETVDNDTDTVADLAKEAEQEQQKPEKKEEKEPKKKRGFFGRKQKKEVDEDIDIEELDRQIREEKEKIKLKQRSGLSQFFMSLNNMGMGKQTNLFIQSVATMLNAGLPLLDSLRTYELETKNRAMRKNLKEIITSVENGTPFWRSMDNQYLFTQYDISMVRIGEEAGSLAENMEYLAEQKEKDRSLRQKVKMAMIYPAIVLTMMFIIVMGLGMFVLPNLVQVLFSLNVELPITTRAVIYVTNIFQQHGKVFVPLSFVLMILVALLAKFTRFKAVTQYVTFRLPGIGRLAREATIARFGVILGGLLQAGVPLVDSLESLVNVTQVVAYKHFYKNILERVKVGDSFSKCFDGISGSTKLLPISVQQLVVTGERSGSLSESLMKTATIYEKKASETAQALPVILEPMLLLFIGALVGVIAFAIIVPIYSVVGNVSGA